MSFFGLSGGGAANLPREIPTAPSAVDVAKAEISAQSDFFQRLAMSCKNKCIVRYLEADLNVGEMSCIDRCSAKFMEVNKLVQESTVRNAETAQKLLEAQQKVLGSPTE